MTPVIYFVASLGRWELGGNDPRNIAVFVASLLCGIAVYFAVAHLLHVPELSELWSAIRSKQRTSGGANS
jgi:hypothetical protein